MTILLLIGAVLIAVMSILLLLMLRRQQQLLAQLETEWILLAQRSRLPQTGGAAVNKKQ